MDEREKGDKRRREDNNREKRIVDRTAGCPSSVIDTGR